MNKKETFNKGFNTGYSIADTNQSELLNPQFWTEKDLEHFQSEMVFSEMENFRQYSPFEFFASAINECHNSEGLWDSYDKGVDAGISRRVKEFKKDNKKGFVAKEAEVYKIVEVSPVNVTDKRGKSRPDIQYHSFYGGLISSELWTLYEVGEVSYQKVIRRGEMPLFSCKNLEFAVNMGYANITAGQTFAVLLCRADVSHVKWGFKSRYNVRAFLNGSLAYKRLLAGFSDDYDNTVYCKKVLVMKEVERINS